MKLSKGSYVGFRIDEGGGTVGIQGKTHIGATTVRLIFIQMMPPLPAMMFQGVLMFLLRFLTLLPGAVPTALHLPFLLVPLIIEALLISPLSFAFYTWQEQRHPFCLWYTSHPELD